MREGYRTPTNFELLEKSDLVVLGRLQSELPSQPDANGVGSLKLEPIRVLKGTLPEQPLTIAGMTEWNGQPIPGLPTSLNVSHFSAGMGACVRIFYPRGGLVLAMFEKGAEGWTQVWAAFARTAEDVEAEDGFWVQAAEAYLALQASAPPAQRRAAVEARVAELATAAPDPLFQAMAIDLQDYLDATGGKERRSRARFWSLLNMPGGVAALIFPSVPGRGWALRCTAGRDGLTLEGPGSRQIVELALVIGGRHFDAAGEQLRSVDGEQMVTGNLPLSEELLQALSSPAASAGVAAGTSTTLAPPADVLPLLARQCRQLRAQPR